MKFAKKSVSAVLIILLAISGVSGPYRAADPAYDTSSTGEVSVSYPVISTADGEELSPAIAEAIPSDADEVQSFSSPEPVEAASDPYENDPICIAGENAVNFGKLLKDLVNMFETQDPGYDQIIEDDLSAIEAVSRKDHSVASSIAEQWLSTYMNRNYQQFIYNGGENAGDLSSSGIPNSRQHAIVVLGYALDFGQMQEELKQRCDAAAALARSFPSSIIVCSGGATGSYNPDKNTEAGLMKKYLVETRGIDASRIYIDEEATDTQQNAENTLRILQENNIKYMTIVTSAYHQRRGQAVYNAAAQLYRVRYGYSVEIVGNYNYGRDAIPKQDVRIAAWQIAGILGLPEDVINTIPRRIIEEDSSDAS